MGRKTPVSYTHLDVYKRQAALMAKEALLIPFDRPNPDAFYAEMEEKLLRRINELGIGPQGFGGETTALSVKIKTAPTHIAGLPVAVNINCHVSRHAERTLSLIHI